MATLSQDDMEKLFSGAPQYFARNDGPFIAVPNPSVAFPFDENLQIRDLTDHCQIEARAWSGVTAHPHLTRDRNHDAAAAAAERHAHFFVRCRERPNMLSLQGLEKGTMGYQAALELGVSDALEEEQFGFDSIGKKARAIVDARERMLNGDGWLHRIPEAELLGRLKRNGELYRNNDLKKRRSTESYNDLFGHFMRPRYIALDKKDSHSLTNQIVALLKCLGSDNVWIDLSHVEWRIRLGQILWGEPHGDRLNGDSSIHNIECADEMAEEKYWLLLQILMATELLIRLDAVTQGEEYGAGAFRAIDIVQFERAANSTVKWSLLLARSWLDNIEIVADAESTQDDAFKEVPPSHDETLVQTIKTKSASWLAAIASHMPFHHHGQNHMTSAYPARHYVIRGRNGQRQVDGLIHFAKKLRWPGIEDYEARITTHMREAVQKRPDTSMCDCGYDAKTKGGGKDDYFGTWDVTCQRGNHKERARARRRRLAAALHPSGWMSKSYIFGLMLPGDGLSHFLMATLLENDDIAMSKLGSFANLCGGFVYSGMSFWSTSCIVGRVLAAGKGSAECMGWVSTDIVPTGVAEGWLNIDVKDVPDDVANLGKKSRIWAKRRLERDSSIVGDGDEDSASPADFTMPWENRYKTPPPNVYVDFASLQLSPSALSLHPTPLPEIMATPRHESAPAPDLFSQPASLTFRVGIDGVPERQHIFSLLHDVNFVNAHPCSPPRGVRFVKSPSSPTIREIDVSGGASLGNASRALYRMGHPLHKFYNYKVMHISEVIQKKQLPLSALLGAGHPDNKAPGNAVLVIDCMTQIVELPQSPVLERLVSPSTERAPGFSFAAQMHYASHKRQSGSDLEILVRSLCSEQGWNAIVSRRKRGCLACAIREAGALGYKVIVRVD
ncbi:hypothetical protein A9K55_005671 [Cordyceps militaris]|uniref:Helicase-like protein n=1 Tax=Cordyceps militaris TaxID=73501 RepID=A0A2H4SDQ1_CORMI|nr:hypothetical protein A9K55_005671 [Cordyceps militaris]